MNEVNYYLILIHFNCRR